MATTAKAIHRHLLHKPKKVANPPAGTAQLTYYIFEGVLAGFVGEEVVHLTAWSGGAGGSKTKDAPVADVVNNPYRYAMKTVDSKTGHVHGGPIPPGAYRIFPPSQHKHLGLSSFLQPLHKLPNKRDGFYIHKQGKHGSDGCIVPADEYFDDLMAKLKASGGGSLYVRQSMDGVFV